VKKSPGTGPFFGRPTLSALKLAGRKHGPVLFVCAVSAPVRRRLSPGRMLSSRGHIYWQTVGLMARKIPIAGTLVFLVLWMALLGFGRSSLLRDPGTFWHVAAGEKMLCDGQVIRADPFSFTRARHPWVAYQWLAECVMAAVFGWCGWDGLVLLAATVLATAYAWLAARMLRAGLHPMPALVLLGLVLAASSHQFHARPVVVSIALVGVVFAWLVDVEQARRRPAALWWLVPLVVLWANLHGGVLAGLGMLGLAVGGWEICWLVGWNSPIGDRRQSVLLALLVACCAAAVLVNPYGLRLPAAWWRTLALPLPELIQEHAPLDLGKPIGWATVALGLIYVVVLVPALRARRRITWLIPLVLLVMTFQRVRQGPLFAVTALVALADMLAQPPWAPWLKARGYLTPPTKRRRKHTPNTPDAGRPARPFPAALLAGLVSWLLPAAVPALVVIAALLLQAGGVRVPVVGRGWARHDPQQWPVGLLPQLKAIEQANAPATRVFNDLPLGGFLIFHAPRLRVFIDDRCALYGAGLLRAYDHARRLAPERIDQWQRRYGFRYALVETNTPFDRYLGMHGRWRLVVRTDSGALYERGED